MASRSQPNTAVEGSADARNQFPPPPARSGSLPLSVVTSGNTHSTPPVSRTVVMDDPGTSARAIHAFPSAENPASVISPLSPRHGDPSLQPQADLSLLPQPLVSQPLVIVQSASSSDPPSQNSHWDPSNELAPPSQPQELARESRVSLPEEAKRYYAIMGESPSPSPRSNRVFPDARSGSLSPDKASAKARSESPLKQAVDSYSIRDDPADSRATPGGDSGEFLDLEDADSLSDSVNDSGRISVADSIDPEDSSVEQAFQESRKDKKHAVVALELYLRSLIALPVKNKDEVIAFFTSDILREAKKPVLQAGYKEGYLTKRGKNFGGWKTRYFVLQGPSLEYYESRGGTHLGSITITGAQIGRQQRAADKKDSDEDNEYRHAFLIIEAKKGPGGSNPRHVLCAESDQDRDSWVEELVRYVTGTYNEEEFSVAQNGGNIIAGRTSTSSNAPSDVLSTPTRRLRKEDITKGPAVPSLQFPLDPSNAKLFQSTPIPSDEFSITSPVKPNPPSYVDPFMDAPLSSSLPVSSPLVAEDPDIIAPIEQRANSEMGHYPDLVDQRSAASKSKQGFSSAEQQRRKDRRRSMNPLKTSPIPERSPSPEKDPALHTPRVDAHGKVKISGPMNGTPIPAGYKFGGKDAPPEPPMPLNDRREKAKSRSFWGFGRPQQDKPNVPVHVPRAVFGVSLEESLDVAEIASLPAIVFRCIQYLEVKKAELEEGIYRLSGSSAVIKALKDRFNNEGDVDLIGSDEYWDPHAIAGLLKTFLRELPASILTRDLHLRFLSVIDFVDPQERIAELSQLIASLPITNYSLLRALTAHLILIVQNANVNKMTMRNVGIVFSPTLGIPAGVFSLMLGEFKRVFNVDGALEQDDEVVQEMGGADLSRRNSKHYSDAAADQLLGLSGRTLTARSRHFVYYIMGFRQAAVLSSVCFFLGVLFICLNVDYRILFKPLTEEAVRDGMEFYKTFFHSPPAIKALMHAIMGVGIIGLAGKLHKWDDSAMFFDGSSLAAYIFAIAVYLSVGVPASRTVATPVEGVDTREDQVEALQILSAGNTIIIVLLGAVLALQAGEEYARRAEAKELVRFAEASDVPGSKPESKKDQ
ncbi:hypothetical protein EW026_g4619 [Hermanssonia centrifuga]|uniref:RhoGAP-domain-containing protein n=1 Tax=Hermanssonia centrifuga TaxID=98765 RepID=A0A4S4KHB3_9APHY|nr:hypothetical protein EW026_g4619 [Hermanssonia centrifuga]